MPPSFMRLTLLFLLLIAPFAAAREPSRTCRILFLGAPANAPKEIHLFDGKQAQKVALPQMNFSEPYALPAGPLTLRLLNEPPVDPEVIDPKTPSATLAAEISDCYLLLSPDPKNQTIPIKIQVIDASSTRFGLGQMLWFNLTPHRVGGVLGTRRLAMEPGSRVIVEAPATGNESYPVEISYHPPNDPRLRPICRTSWQHNPEARSVYFVVQEPDKRAPRILGFPDYRPAASTKPSE